MDAFASSSSFVFSPALSAAFAVLSISPDFSFPFGAPSVFGTSEGNSFINFYMFRTGTITSEREIN